MSGSAKYTKRSRIILFIALIMVIILMLKTYYPIFNKNEKQDFTLISIDYNKYKIIHIFDVCNNYIAVEYDNNNTFFSDIGLIDLRNDRFIEIGEGWDVRLNDRYLVGIDPGLNENGLFIYEISSGKKYKLDTKCDVWGDDNNIDLSGELVVWNDIRNNNKTTPNLETELYYYNLTTKKEERITYSLYGITALSNYHNLIVWSETLEDDSEDIKMFDIETNITLEIDSGTTPSIYDDFMVYKSDPLEDEFYLSFYRISNGDIIEIQNSHCSYMAPDFLKCVKSFDLYGSKVVWDTINEIIMLYDIEKDESIEIVNQSLNDEIEITTPKIWGDKIYFVENNNGLRKVYFYQLHGEHQKNSIIFLNLYSHLNVTDLMVCNTIFVRYKIGRVTNVV